MQLSNFSKTGIVATLGPASESAETIRAFIEHRVCTFRLNFSHGTFDEHQAMLDRINQVRGEFLHSVAVMGDLCGPKIRTGLVAPCTVLVDEQELDITVGETVGNATGITTAYADFVTDVQPGQRILIDDGRLVLGVLAKTNRAVRCKVLVGGGLSSHKGINLPDTQLSTPAITPKDWQCVDWAIEHELDYLALSFVQHADEIRTLKEYLKEKDSAIQAVAKIEKPLAVENIEAIIHASDAILIARGDMGVEMDLAQVPLVQKKITSLCRRFGKPAIVATQVLQSMIDNPSPTRAEASDICNAVMDFADAIMLSGETAVGKYPLEAVTSLAHISRTTEVFLDASDAPRPKVDTVPEMASKESVARSVAQMLDEIKAALVVASAETGNMTRLLSKARIDVPILSLCGDELLARRLSLCYGTLSVHHPRAGTYAEWVESVEHIVLENRWASSGQKLLLLPPLELLSAKTDSALILHTIKD
ncbi:MAG: pyruvate kinase [Phycisphaerae bacterium]|nr:pyruvate kinase [Phycisphaerae bacterium]